MQRLITAVALVAFFGAALFLLPGPWFFLVLLLAIELAALELVRLARFWAPEAPLRALLFLVPLVAVAAAGSLGGEGGFEPLLLLAAVALLPVGAAGLVLAGGTPVAQSMAALGALVFGTLYLAVPVVAFWHLQGADPWLVVLLVAIVAANDSGAYYVGSTLGRHKMAPRISPNKTWEGAAAGLAAGTLAAVLWSWWRLAEVDAGLVAVGALVAAAGQVGDLAESMLKRGAGVKDSGTLLPGHGGLLDRTDALLFAAPVLTAGLFWLGRL